MNEEELKEEHECDFDSGSSGCEVCFQKGKLEQKKEEFVFLEDKFIMLNTPEFDNNDAGMVRDDIKIRLEQLSKEIGVSVPQKIGGIEE